MMKKKAFILSLVLIGTLSACGIMKKDSGTEDNTIQENAKVTDTANDEKKQPKEKEDTQKTDKDIAETEFCQEYAIILDRYVSALNEKWDGNELMQNGLNLLALDLYGDNSLNLIGYNVIDFDGNGIKELVIGTTEQVQDDFYQKIIFDVYTNENDGACTQILSSTARNRYFYAGGNLFVDLGSSGANDSTNATLEYNGKGLTDTDTITEPSNYVQIELLPMSNWIHNE